MNKGSNTNQSNHEGNNVGMVVDSLLSIRNRLFARLYFLQHSELDYKIWTIKKSAQRTNELGDPDSVYRKKKLDNMQRAFNTLLLLKKVVTDLVTINQMISVLTSKYGEGACKAAIPRRLLATDIPFTLVNTDGAKVKIDLGKVIRRIMSLDPGIRYECNEVLRNINSSIHVHDPNHPATTRTLVGDYSASMIIPLVWGKVEERK